MAGRDSVLSAAAAAAAAAETTAAYIKFSCIQCGELAALLQYK